MAFTGVYSRILLIKSSFFAFSKKFLTFYFVITNVLILIAFGNFE